ncbi:Alpha/beta hydrolase family protein [Novipirellula aureliae]|uniref:Alpha/beta hydrolase family protein n=1 Tax=Novipirellula aureliae TaxID=2527966 RepID=A0A5C6E2T8_9BACT|nr:alpha/beta hydrolase [Novipirellula aureliae]TWU43242.1 Alpha/beta hydrolase family protein [Novipirellula aureliae]
MSEAPPSNNRPRKRLLYSVGRIIALSYLAVLVALVAMETRLVYPGAFMDADRQLALDLDPDITTVVCTAADGVQTKGRLVEKPDAEQVVLFLHGNGTKAIWQDSHIESISRDLNAHVLAAEFRGFAGDDHTPSEAGIIADSIGARDYLCARYDLAPSGIIVYGESLGGGCAAAVAAKGGAKVLILERTFDRLVDISADMYPWVPVKLLMRNRFDSVARLSDYDGPFIQLHGDADTLIPIENGRNLFQSVPTTDKVWIEMQGIGHNDSLPPSARAQLKAAVKSIVGING